MNTSIWLYGKSNGILRHLRNIKVRKFKYLLQNVKHYKVRVLTTYKDGENEYEGYDDENALMCFKAFQE